jgi:hypothetical protein
MEALGEAPVALPDDGVRGAEGKAKSAVVVLAFE